MNLQKTIDQVRNVCRMRRLSRHTESCYVSWIRRFTAHVRACDPTIQREEKVRLFLQALAPKSAASTQNQALNAVVFLYRDVLRQPLGDLGRWARAA